ncbi:MAG: serine/threonine-protein kinase [Myxococcota bacterium]
MSNAHDLTGVTLDKRYRLTRLMGEGGMGQVYEGTHEILDHQVAVKVLLPRFAHDATFRERFLREAKAASKVRHPNVVQIIDFGDTPNNSVYFVMEFLEGRDLEEMLDESGPLPWPRAQPLLLQITSALAAAHEHRIIHRDVKPANCFVTHTQDEQERVKLLDFGIAKITADPNDQGNSRAKNLTGTGEVFGTARYMAPEQADGASNNDPRIDVYSVGVMAYEMLTGRVPFDGPSTFQILTKHVNDSPRPPRELNPQIPAEVEALILRALAKRPDDRFGSMAEMAHVIHEIGLSPNIPAHTPTAPSDPPPGRHGPGAGQTWPQSQQAPPAVPPTQHLPAYGGKPAVPAPAGPYIGPGGPPHNEGSHHSKTEPLSQTEEVVGTGPQRRWSAPPETLELPAQAQGHAGPPKGLILGIAGIATVLGAIVAMFLLSSSNEVQPISAPARKELLSDEHRLHETTGPLMAGSGEPSNETSASNAFNEPEESTSSTRAANEPGYGDTEPGSGDTEPESGDTEPEPGDSAQPAPMVDLEPQAKPSNNSQSPRSKSRSKPKAKKTLTDRKVQSRLIRTFRKKCRSGGKQAQVKVSIVVGSNGRVLSKSVAGVSDPTKQCLLTEAGKANFPSGNTRRLVVEVTL